MGAAIELWASSGPLFVPGTLPTLCAALLTGMTSLTTPPPTTSSHGVRMATGEVRGGHNM